MIVWLTEAEEFVGKCRIFVAVSCAPALEAARIEVTYVRAQNTPFSAVPLLQRSRLKDFADASLSHNFKALLTN
jgi:hypothetical protein